MQTCDIGEYLDYKNCMCRKRIIDKLVEECSENIYENKTLDIIPLNAVLLNVFKKVCNSCMVYIVLFVIFLITSICICSVFIYLHLYLKKYLSTNFSAGYLNIEITIIKQINIKNRPYCFYNDLVKFLDFDLDMLKLDKKTFKAINIYYIEYVTKKEEYKINSVNPSYLLIYKIDGFIEEKRWNKYLNTGFTDNYDEVLKKYKEVLSGIISCIDKISSNKSGEYEKDYMKIEFHSDDKLPLNKQLKFLIVTIVIRSVFESRVNTNYRLS